MILYGCIDFPQPSQRIILWRNPDPPPNWINQPEIVQSEYPGRRLFVGISIDVDSQPAARDNAVDAAISQILKGRKNEP